MSEFHSQFGKDRSLNHTSMSRQDKATTDKFARTLRELVKRPENKVCADCKRNGLYLFARFCPYLFIARQILDGPHGICESQCLRICSILLTVTQRRFLMHSVLRNPSRDGYSH